MAELSDQLLLSAYCRGDREAFDALYRRYVARIYATAYRLTGSWEDAEDALQEVFLQLATKAGSIRRGEALSSWLYRATFNRSIDIRRRNRNRIGLDEQSAQGARVVAVESLRREALENESQWRDQMLREIGEHILDLPERQAAVFVFHGFQGLSYMEIAEVLDTTEGACRTNYSLACTRLREIMEKQGREAEWWENGRGR